MSTVLYEKQGPIAILTLNRPERLNTYNTQMRDELFSLLYAIREDPEVMAVLLHGNGRGFSAGADLTEFNTFPSVMEGRRIRWLRDVWGLMLSIPAPIMVVAHGFCLGDGLEMSLLADIRYAAEGTQFGLPETALGFLPGAGGSQTFPRAVGLGQGLDVLLTGRRIDSQEAYQMGLINRILPREGFLEEALSDLRSWLDQGRLDFRLLKRASQEGLNMTMAQALELEQRLARIGGRA